MQRLLFSAGLVAVVLCGNAPAQQTPGSKAQPDKNDKIPLPGLEVSLGMLLDEGIEFHPLPDFPDDSN